MKKWLPLLALLLASTAHAQKPEEHGGLVVNGGSSGRVVDRLRSDEAELGITSRNGKVSLLLTRDALTMQLTDRALREIDRDMERDARNEEENDGSLGRLISSVVRGSVKSALDHGWQYDLEEIQDVRYDDGRLIITDCDGDTVLENVDVDDENAMEGFAPDDARRFVKEFRRLKARQWT
jgi:hypothetical protein